MQRAGANSNAAAAAAVSQQSSSKSSRRGGCDLISAGDYTFCPDLDFLADGVTSRVYRCRHNATGDFYALKVFNSAPPKREIELLQKLKHDNIVQLVNEVRFKDSMGRTSTALVLEFCPGKSLHEFLKRPENKLGMQDRDFMALLYNMCDGLGYLREKLQIVHRDIKPGNIMIVYDNRHQPVFKLADFGSGRILEDGADAQSLVGTYEFLHPGIYLEVHRRLHAGAIAAGETSYSGHRPECDLWSLGVTLYYSATGRLPFAPFEGVRNNHAKMIEMMVGKPKLAISATQDERNGPVKYQDSLPPTCPLSAELQNLLTELLRGILVPDFDHQWSFQKFFETINRRKSQHYTYYFVAGNMLLPDLVFSPKQSLDSLLSSLASVTGFAKEEIVVFYRSQEVSAFPTGSTRTNPTIVLSKQSFKCTLDIAKLDVSYVNARPAEPNPNEPKEMKDYVDEAHRHAVACRQLATACHLNHALTLEAKDAIMGLLDRRGREAYQRAGAKLALGSSSQQKVGRLMDLAQLVQGQTKCQSLSDKISQWRRECESVSCKLAQLRPEPTAGGSGSSSLGDVTSSLVPSQQLTDQFTSIFAHLLAPQQDSECLSVSFQRIEQVYDRYSQMINRYMIKDPTVLGSLMRRSFPSDRSLLDRSLDECQRTVANCCIETLGRVQAGLAQWMSIVQSEVAKLERLESALLEQDFDLGLLHDKVYRGVSEALKDFFTAHQTTKESDLDALGKSIQGLISSTDLVQIELLRNTQLLRELDELGLKNTGKAN